MEEWKDIADYEGIYQVSNLGRVKSLGNNKSRQEKILKLQLHRTGYLLVKLCKEGKKRNYKVHRLVAQAFIPNPDNKSQVNHRDENKSNNKVENLEWMTCKENINHGTRTSRTCKPICGINIKTNKRIEFPSTAEAGRSGFDPCHIVNCLKGRRKTHKGHRWFYIV